jgi:hypothetical protein
LEIFPPKGKNPWNFAKSTISNGHQKRLQGLRSLFLSLLAPLWSRRFFGFWSFGDSGLGLLACGFYGFFGAWAFAGGCFFG